LSMSAKLLAVFCTLIVHAELLVMVPLSWFEIPLPPVFATVIVPELVIVPKLSMPSPAEFAMTRVVPAGITSSSPAAILLPLVVIVHVFGTHVPPILLHVVESSVKLVACASGIEIDRTKARTANIGIKRTLLTRTNPRFYESMFYKRNQYLSSSESSFGKGPKLRH